MTTAYTFAFLSAQDMPEVHQAFLDAFADYYVPIQLSKEQFDSKLEREGIAPPFCVGAYAGAKLVGFILTGLGEFNGKPTAYNAGTGVFPAHRGNGLTKKMYAYLMPKLLQSGVEQCLLEVIQENTAALKSYKSIGLNITRALDCFRVRKEDLLLKAQMPEDMTITATIKPDWKAYTHLWDATPTWQNTAIALKCSPDEKVVLEARNSSNEIAGAAVFFPKSGAIAQIGVLPSYRGEGIGKALLQQIVNETNAPALMLINVDADAVAFKTFLKRRNFKRFLGQYEMVMLLG